MAEMCPAFWFGGDGERVKCAEPPHGSMGAWCAVHGNQRRAGKPFGPRQRFRHDGCSVSGCTKPHASKGLCRFHYQRQKRNTPAYRKSGWSILVNALEIGGRCSDGSYHWLVTVNIDPKGYSRVGASSNRSHRLAWETWVGPIPKGHLLDHAWHGDEHPDTCPKNCVNPAHLTPMTRSEHTKLAIARGEVGRHARRSHVTSVARFAEDIEQAQRRGIRAAAILDDSGELVVLSMEDADAVRLSVALVESLDRRGDQS